VDKGSVTAVDQFVTVPATPRPPGVAPRLAIVVPCYNEEQVLDDTISRLTGVLDELLSAGLVHPESGMVFVDDGSRDGTWPRIVRAHLADGRVSGVKLAHNAGHQKALLAGMDAAAGGDCVISIDADLQDDPGVMADFVRAYLEGYDVVYGVRRSRETDTPMKRWTALGFYRLMGSMGVDIVYNHADYRLLSRKALDALQGFSEANLFLRGMVPLIGLASTQVFYDRHKRLAGESKYPVGKMLAFALEGITSTSVRPIRLVGVGGAGLAVLAVFSLIGLGIADGAGGAVPFWSYILVSLWLLGGLQLVATGLVGEYVGKTYQEAKRRPRYLVETTVGPVGGTSGRHPAAPPR
jgi:polyisoprenyl-phosphate glycosyltransferase